MTQTPKVTETECVSEVCTGFWQPRSPARGGSTRERLLHAGVSGECAAAPLPWPAHAHRPRAPGGAAGAGNFFKRRGSICTPAAALHGHTVAGSANGSIARQWPAACAGRELLGRAGDPGRARARNLRAVPLRVYARPGRC